MIPVITFLLGLLLGIGVYYWKERQFNLRLKQILNLLPNQGDSMISFSLISKVRREMLFLQDLFEQQKQQLQLWEQLLEKAPIGYLQVDQDNQLLWCNQKAQEILKITDWQTNQLRLLLELVRSYELDQLIQNTRKFQQDQIQIWEFYTKNFQNQNQIQAVILKGYSFPLLRGEVGVFVENVQSMVDAARLRERAFSDLTHELRTPLTSIALVAETLEKRLQNPEKRWVEKMSQETQRLIKLVEGWLEVSQISQNPTQYLQYQLIDLQELVLTSWHTIEPLAKQKQLELDYIAPKNISLQGDRSRLTQVFLNLFDNSIKYSPAQQKIQVLVEIINLPENNPWLQINIIDFGSGFSAGDLPYVFERLYRGDPSRTRQSNFGGSGLGLTIVQQIIKAHGGHVKAENHPETGGAWLQLTLPQKNNV